MSDEPEDCIRTREILFQEPHDDPDQAGSACRMVPNVDGVLSAEGQGLSLVITYDITRVTLQLIEELLSELGYHLDGSLLSKIRRALYYYTEDLQRENMGCKNGDCTREVFIARYRRLQHGCRDDRPDHWRHYR